MTDGLRPVVGDDGPMAVRGGIGGIRFQWEELEEAARVLAVLAADAGEVAVGLGYLNGEVSELPWRIMHLHLSGGVAGPQYQSALARLDGAWTASLENARALAAAEDRLRAALLAYRLADDAALAVTEAARQVSDAAARGLARTAIDSGALSVAPIGVEAADLGVPVRFDGTVSGVLERLAAVEDDAPGTFEVLRTGTEDEPVYVVVLPGMQGSGLPGRDRSNPFDVGGIGEALTEDSRFTEEAVLQALGRAGAREGDALMIAGYSEGGLHAVNLAEPDGLGGRYDVQLVLTAGSPTGWSTSGGTEYLHLEHEADPVPRLDSVQNGDDRHRTTVTLATPIPEPAEQADGSAEPRGFGRAHKLENYAVGARLVDSGNAPSLAPATALLAAAGGAARRYSFTATRRPPFGSTPPSGSTSPSEGRRREADGRSRLWP
ncbi:hypothetical protein C4K88_13405 [Arthrobacter pityocampae]|uniref:PE-PPE domain-containing protein n=1 Tax=Arthrobacter pityocampae TaxID=547334 RepID=A0A2S5IVX0_9MICC|nr:hypothetical protein [Arthrobacter pityocampae]PPB48709.1 hypothetical protein C4K88_13405 [Arthrobacter pityocampae]